MLSGHYNRAFNRVDITSDTVETLADGARGDTSRAVAGALDTAMDFGGNTPATFAASVAWDELGGARGAVDTYRTGRHLIQAGPMAALFEVQRAMRCQRP